MADTATPHQRVQEVVMKPRTIVRDDRGNHFKILKKLPDGRLSVESVVTKQTYIVPANERLTVVAGLWAAS